MNQKTILKWSIVNEFFFNPLMSLTNFIVLQITIQAIKIKVDRLQDKTF